MTDPTPEPLAHPRTVRRLWWVIGAALGAGLLAFMLRGADQPKNPSLLPSGVTTPTPGSAAAIASTRNPLPGFGETAITVNLPSGQVLQWCVLLASTDAQQAQGLMHVADPTLGGYDGMLFRFPGAQKSAFYMANTPMPLSIAFFASGGAFVSQTDMAPCLDVDPTKCELYHAAAPYETALEVPQGQLTRLGISAEATIEDLQRPCTA